MTEPAQPETAPTPYPAAGPFVGAVWLLLVAAALAFVARYGSNVPVQDGWDLLPGLTGEAALGDWLWEGPAGPLPRLAVWATVRPSGDLRAALYLAVGLHAGLALLLIATAHRVRGHTSYADACFPIFLLNWGLFENFLAAHQLGAAVAAGLAVLALRVILLAGADLQWRTVVAAGVVGSLAAWCGGPAWVYLPVLGLWLAVLGVRAWLTREPTQRVRAGVLGLTLAAVAGQAVFVLGHSTTAPAGPEGVGLLGTLRTALEFVTTAWGLAGELAWPVSGVGTALLLATALVLLVAAWGNLEYRDSLRIVGLFLFLLGGLTLAGLVGRDRAGYGPGAGFAPRHVALAVPTACAAFFAATLYGGRVIGSLVPMGVFALTCTLLVPNMRSGAFEGSALRQRTAAFAADAAGGMPAGVLAERYAGLLHPAPEVLERGLESLRRAGHEPYRRLEEAPAGRGEVLAAAPTPAGHAAVNGDTGYGTNDRAGLAYDLPRPTFVLAVRVAGTYLDRAKPGQTRFHARWQTPDGAGHEQTVLLAVAAGSDDKTAVVWVNDTVTRIELSADEQPWAFRVRAVELVTPTAGPGGPPLSASR